MTATFARRSSLRLRMSSLFFDAIALAAFAVFIDKTEPSWSVSPIRMIGSSTISSPDPKQLTRGRNPAWRLAALLVLHSALAGFASAADVGKPLPDLKRAALEGDLPATIRVTSSMRRRSRKQFVA